MIKFEKLPADIRSRFAAMRDVLEREQDVVFAYLFGSLATDTTTAFSDVDVAVYLEEPDRFAERKMDIFHKLTEALQTTELDLVVLNSSPISLVGRIIQGRRVIVDKQPPVRHSFESLKLREFSDFRFKEEALFARRFGHG